MRTDDQHRVSLSDPGDIAAAVPHLLGFRPDESVVLVGLGGASGSRVRLTLRADLPAPSLTDALAADLTQRLMREEPAGALVVVVSEDRDDEHPTAPIGDLDLPHRDLVHALVLALAAREVPVRKALLVRGGRWWDFDCPHPCCAPGVGTPLPEEAGALAAVAVAEGRVVAASREELAARLAPAREAQEAVLAAVLRVGQDCVGRVAAVGWEGLTEESWTAVVEAVARLRPGTVAALPVEHLARVSWGLRDVRVRDRAVRLTLGDDADAAAALWIECVRRMPPPLDAAPATLLALTEWLRGDGASAGLALDRARSSDPRYSFAQLLEEALDRGVSPTQLRSWVADGLQA